MAARVKSSVGGFKLGLEFFAANGPAGIREFAKFDLPIFLDLKLHDIPNTVSKTVAALAPLRPALLTVHAAGGRAMLEAARAAAPPETWVIAVTVLTSLDKGDFGSIGLKGLVEEQVARLADLARTSGVDGIVCSGNEVRAARRSWPEGHFVVPGVRLPGADAGDQKRVMSPAEALDAGASVLVVGRPITAAEDPAAAAATIASSLETARTQG